ncbi:MAG: methylated-DNA--[protein]-cysteine S-methyltransferase [Steroidobacteraceae bacterium]
MSRPARIPATVAPLATKTVETPVGRLRLIASERGLAAVLWENDPPGRVKFAALEEQSENAVLCEAERQLQEYFAGTRRSFDLPLHFSGTEFQQRVWNALLTIPFGETRSYGDIAVQLGNPRAVRAVGAANGKNPLSIVAPCHRVIGSNGQLVGFAGGVETKRYLLGHEKMAPAS